MPEGHVIHRVARDHRKRLVGDSPSVSSPQGRFRRGARRLDRRMLERVEAHGKHLFYWWDGALILHIHLGLYGKFRNNRIITADPVKLGKSAARMRRDERLLVYKRATCRECGQAIASWKLAARTIYACQCCQR